MRINFTEKSIESQYVSDLLVEYSPTKDRWKPLDEAVPECSRDSEAGVKATLFVRGKARLCVCFLNL